ncbi:MAG: hypothetical protein ACYSUK_12950, partial [Planctomycetota bacterium]
MTKRLKEILKDKNNFSVIVELACGPGFNFLPIEKFLGAYAENGDAGLDSDFDFVGITVPQNPSGIPNLEPSEVLIRLKEKGLLDSLDFIPHISCKDANSGMLVSSLVGFQDAEVESLLILTGDKPIDSKGVFELDSIGLLELIKRMNNESYIKARPENLGEVHQFFTSAAVSPFKYTEASQMQQYYKMEKKIAAG